MSRTIIFSLVFLLTVASCKTSKKFVDEQFEQAIANSEEIAQKIFENNNFPGLSIMVGVNGKIVWSKGVGYADLENETPVDPDFHKFRIGSISKSITAAALAKLYEAGKVDLTAPIQTYVPYFPEKEYSVNLLQVSGHLGGIRHYRGSEFLSTKYYKTVKDGIEIFKDDPLIFEPGLKYAYSSYGWNLISAAIEGAAQQDFLPFLQKAVFKPLKMNKTMADIASEEISGRVKFYELEDDKIVEAPYVDNSYKWAGGGLLSTADDLVKFAHAHAKPGYLRANTLKLWTTSQKTATGETTNYGIGWRSGIDEFGNKWYGHSGGSVGGTSMMAIYPKEQIVVITLVNLSSAKMNDLAFKVANEFIQAKAN